MTINLQKPDITELKPRITIFGVGGGGGNAVNNMIASGLEGVEFVAANTDAQALTASKCERLIQMGLVATQGLGAGSQPEVGYEAAQECIDEIKDHLSGVHMAFVTAGMGGGTGTGAAPVVAQVAREANILTVGVVTKPFAFEGKRRMEIAEAGIAELQKHVDTLLVIPNQNLFRVANENTTFAEAFSMADQVLYSGVACITDLMVKKGLINLDFADVRSVMRDMGRAIMGTGEDSGEGRALKAAEAAISNPLLDETSMKGAQGLLISITGGADLTLSEVDEATSRIEKEVDTGAIIHFGATLDESFEGKMRVSVVATGVTSDGEASLSTQQPRFDEAAEKLRKSAAERSMNNVDTAPITPMAPVAPITPVSPVAPVVPIASVETEIAEPAQPAQVEQTELTTDEFSQALNEELNEELSEGIENSITQPVAEPATASLEEVSQLTEVEEENENGPIGLLRRLTTGLGASEENAQQEQNPETVIASAEPAEPVETQQETEPTLDLNNQEDDQLDIPAFLRRQAR